ncbi:MAG: hypothetical protein NVSMB16_01240 [Acidimicrobiales bacterium]
MSEPLLVGMTLPTFAADGSTPVESATAAEAAGLDGAFVFDHLWPLGSPGRPALWSFAVLAAVAGTTEQIALGPLVARVGLLPAEDLQRAFETLAAIAGPGRLIAALGAGDHLSAAENLAYGVGYPSAKERLGAVGSASDALRERGIRTWIGGQSQLARETAVAHADAINVWGSRPADLRRIAQDPLMVGHRADVTWAGQVLIGRDPPDLARLTERYGSRPNLIAGTIETVAGALRELGAAGASWCVLAPLNYLHEPLEAVETVCLVAEAVR